MREVVGRAREGLRRALREMCVCGILLPVVLIAGARHPEIDYRDSPLIFAITAMFFWAVSAPFTWAIYRAIRFITGSPRPS